MSDIWTFYEDSMCSFLDIQQINELLLQEPLEQMQLFKHFKGDLWEENVQEDED